MHFLFSIADFQTRADWHHWLGSMQPVRVVQPLRGITLSFFSNAPRTGCKRPQPVAPGLSQKS